MSCPTCGTENPTGAKFCLNCGSRLEARPPEGERRFVTVLFADVVDSTAMGEQIDPEQVAEIMNGAFSFFNSAVSQYGGTVARLMGDAILALFGAPIAHEDDAERAVHAGLAIQEAAAKYAQAIKETYGVDFQVRVGINSGLAVLAMVGDEVKMEYTAMGDTANVAARMQNAAEPGTVLMSADTYRLVRGIFYVQARGPIEVKGKSAPIETYVVTGTRSSEAKMRGLEGLASPLVARGAELGLLQGKVEEALPGQGSVVAVIGEAGLGKSRLIAELRRWVGDLPRAVTWLEGRALSYGQPIAYYPWRQIISQAIDVRDADATEVVRDHLRRIVPAEDLPYLERMLAVESPETSQTIADLTGEEVVQHIAESMKRFVEALAKERPTVLVFDDMHWADEPSLHLLNRIAETVGSGRLMIVFSLRPDREVLSWAAREQLQKALGDRFTAIELEALSATDARQLLGNLLDIKELPDSVLDLILRQSDGNPFFLEEVIRSLIDSGHIVRDNHHWRATSDIVDVSIPSTLAGILASRIDRLPEETKRVVQTAAVIGRIFPYPVLTATIHEAPPAERIDNPRPHLDVLTDEELVRERVRDPELEYIFKHALTQEAAYDLLLIRRRKEYHRRVAEVLERLHAGQLDDMSPMLAHHFWVAEEWEKAASYFLRAARGAASLSGLREAVDDYDRAYQALKRMPEPPAASVIDAILGWIEYGAKLHGYEEAIERLEEAERLARPSGDKRRLAAVLNWIGNTHMLAGFPSRGAPALMEGYRLAEEIGDERLNVLPMFLTTTYMVERDPGGALAQLDQVAELARKYHRPDIEAHTRAVKGMAYARLGEFGPASKTLQEANELVERADAPVKVADVHAVTALAYFDMGEFDRGIEYSQRAEQEAKAVSWGECSIYAQYCTGIGHVRKADLEEARTIFTEALRQARQIHSESTQYFAHNGLALVETLSGDKAAFDRTEQARTGARAVGDEYSAALLALAAAEAQLRAGNLHQANEALQAALTYYRRVGMRPYLARGLGILSEIRDHQGRTEEASSARREAEQLAAELNAALADVNQVEQARQGTTP